MEHAIVLDGLSKRYGSGEAAVAALRDVGLTIAAGEFVSITGPSGCGKSTLLNLIAGLDTPSSGSVVVAGRDLASLSDEERSRVRLEHVGFVFQTFNLFPTFSVLENVLWPLEFRGVKLAEARARAAEALTAVGLGEATHARFPAQLSGGEQQRVAIARALAGRPEILLADEPTGNLDSRTGRAILDLLLELNQERGLTIVLVTHSTFAATYGHRTVELLDGTVVRDVSPRKRPSLTPVPR